MSRVGKNPVAIPSGVTAAIADDTITVKGKLGELALALRPELVDVQIDAGAVRVSPKLGSKQSRMMWGTTRACIKNLVTGVSEGFTVNLEINGVGYRAALEGSDLVLSLGYSHPVRYPIPKDITVKVERPTVISLHGADKQKVGQMASEIRAYRPPEPFKGKGVKYEGEQILRKEGKKK